jgi:hypothetical protein
MVYWLNILRALIPDTDRVKECKHTETAVWTRWQTSCWHRASLRDVLPAYSILVCSIYMFYHKKRSWSSSVDISTDCGSVGRGMGFNSRRGKRFICPDGLWGLSSLLSICYGGESFPRDKAVGGVKRTTHHHLVTRSRKMGLYLHSPILSSWRDA